MTDIRYCLWNVWLNKLYLWFFGVMNHDQGFLTDWGEWKHDHCCLIFRLLFDCTSRQTLIYVLLYIESFDLRTFFRITLNIYSNLIYVLSLTHSNSINILCLMYSNLINILCLTYSNSINMLCLMYSNLIYVLWAH
jgi:hypothetical protein